MTLITYSNLFTLHGKKIGIAFQIRRVVAKIWLTVEDLPSVWYTFCKNFALHTNTWFDIKGGYM